MVKDGSEKAVYQVNNEKDTGYSNKSANVPGDLCCRCHIGIYMRNSIVKCAIKIAVIAIMLLIGAYIGLWNNNQAQEAYDNRQYGIIDTSNNWLLVVPMLLVTIAFIPAGYLLGRKIDKDN